MSGPELSEINGGEKQLTVHHVLAHSYTFYLLFFIIAVVLDTLSPIKIFKSSYMLPTGFVLLILASLLIFWAQSTSRNLETQDLRKENFMKGPYAFTRSPTHWGLFLLVLGFGIIINAVYLIIFSIVAQIISKTFFLSKEEAILEEKYGLPYREYKESVRL